MALSLPSSVLAAAALGLLPPAAAAATNAVVYIRIPVLRIPSTVVEQTEVPQLRVQGLSLDEQSARLALLLSQWAEVHRSVSGQAIHPQSHFGRRQAAILAKAASEGVSDDVMQMLADYQAQLNLYLKHRTLDSKKEP